MSRTRILIVANAVLVATAVLVWIFSGDGKSLPDLVREAGYYELVPPSTFHGPGTINTVEVVGERKIQLHPTCEMDAAMLATAVRESRTVSRKLVRKISKGFDVAARVEEYLSASGTAEQVESVDISLENVSILLMTHESLIKVQQQIIKEGCQEAIMWNLDNGGIVCQTEAVLKADVKYRIGFQNGTSLDERARLTRDLAAEFNITVNQDGQDRMVGDGLFFGVKLAPRGIVLNVPRTSTTDCNSNL